MDTLEPDDAQEGKIVTPLPPNKVHNSQGIVTPKLPIEVERGLAERLKEAPEELLPNEPES